MTCSNDELESVTIASNCKNADMSATIEHSRRKQKVAFRVCKTLQFFRGWCRLTND